MSPWRLIGWSMAAVAFAGAVAALCMAGAVVWAFARAVL
jgi:hypothetical protein